jgi:hypothetical protein
MGRTYIYIYIYICPTHYHIYIYIPCMGQMRDVCHNLSDSLKGKYHLKGLNIGGRMIVKVYFKGPGSEYVNCIYLSHCVD